MAATNKNVRRQHWRNAAEKTGSGHVDSGPFKADQSWVHIERAYEFVDETELIKDDYETLLPDDARDDGIDIQQPRLQQPESPGVAEIETLRDGQGGANGVDQDELEFSQIESPRPGPGDGPREANRSHSQTGGNYQAPHFISLPHVQGSDLSQEVIDVSLVGNGLAQVTSNFTSESALGTRSVVTDERRLLGHSPESRWSLIFESPDINSQTTQHRAGLSPNDPNSDVASTIFGAGLPPSRSPWPPPAHRQKSPALPEKHPAHPLTSAQEAFLMRRFSEIGEWIDLADSSRNFSYLVPQLALHDCLLKSLMIATAAKQLFLVGELEDGKEIAEKSYDTAISVLIQRIECEKPLSANTFIALIISASYEMLSTNGVEWHNHLGGGLSFAKAQGISGSCGGINEVVFWATARQEVVRCILARSRLRLDPDLWNARLDRMAQDGQEDLAFNQ
ncbi:hypothetical protein PV04_05700 [Phialophora macrospora]|uniref:Transcription factor domain-containing protein n=1 Tax=Phialophora macrospora TaxID=1851006 RepID=A0A0D2G2L7_9EURO|nr:hypothetical protein PV04_05700 [Phialophora macrospora]